jgi:hypothetical protein
MFVTRRDKSYFSVVRAKEMKQVLMRLDNDRAMPSCKQIAGNAMG